MLPEIVYICLNSQLWWRQSWLDEEKRQTEVAMIAPCCCCCCCWGLSVIAPWSHFSRESHLDCCVYVHSVCQLLCSYYTTRHNSPARRNRFVFVMEEEAAPTLLSRVTQVCTKYLEFTLSTNRRWICYTRKHGCMFLRPSWPMIIISFSPSTGGRQPFSLWYNWSVLFTSQTSSLSLKSLMFNQLSQPKRCSQLSSSPTSWNQPRSWCLWHSPPRQLPSSSDHQAGVQGELAACEKSNL